MLPDMHKLLHVDQDVGMVCTQINMLNFYYYYYYFYALLSRDNDNPGRVTEIWIYCLDWTNVYDTHNKEHRTEPVST